MASSTRFAPHGSLSATTLTSSLTSSTSSSTKTRPARWARALGLVLLCASLVLASPEDELPEPALVANIWLPNLDGLPQATATPGPLATPESVEGLLLDTRIRLVEEGEWTALQPGEHELKKRTVTASVTTTLEIPVSTLTGSTTTTSSASSTSTDSSSTASSSPLPSFFDGGLSNNFTSSTCPTFINNMIDAEEFQTCYPISLLLQGSNSFFEAEKSLVSISRVLDNACAANVTGCANYLASVASNLTKTENCGDDYDAGNPTVTEAYLGLVAYQVVYSATCLKDDTSQSYCFGDAVTNTTNASQTYFYFLPLNSTLPGGVVPLCGTCLQDTMSIYHVATANRKQPIADTYASAAEMVDELCGADFANATLAEAIATSGASSTISRGPSIPLLMTTLLAMAVGCLI